MLLRKDVVEMARHIIDMDMEIEELRDEVERLREYEQKYHDEIRRSIEHGQKMIGGLLTIAATPGVLDAIAASKSGAGQP